MKILPEIVIYLLTTVTSNKKYLA